MFSLILVDIINPFRLGHQCIVNVFLRQILPGGSESSFQNSHVFDFFLPNKPVQIPPHQIVHWRRFGTFRDPFFFRNKPHILLHEPSGVQRGVWWRWILMENKILIQVKSSDISGQKFTQNIIYVIMFINFGPRFDEMT